MKLDIPYRSQNADDAKLYDADCGPTCLVMILNYYGVTVTPNEIYDHLGPKGKKDFTFIHEMIDVMKTPYDKELRYKKSNDKHEALAVLKESINNGQPLIALVKYEPWKDITGNGYEDGHFVVVTGYDEANILMNDPIFNDWRSTNPRGAHFKMPIDLFCAGWAGFIQGENPNWACLIASDGRKPEQAPPPIVQPKPPVHIIPADHPLSEPVLTPNAERRILALAEYRWAEKPNLNDLAEKQLWLTHLGDFGAEADQHVVGSGESFSSLSARYYGDQTRWKAIQAFNNLNRTMLWLNDVLLIPRLGSSGAHQNEHLPQGEYVQTRSLSIDDNPDQTAADLNSIGEGSKGMGFYDG